MRERLGSLALDRGMVMAAFLAPCFCRCLQKGTQVKNKKENKSENLEVKMTRILRGRGRQ